MPIIRKNTVLTSFINGVASDNMPLSIDDITVMVTFGDGSMQPNITTESVEFEGKEAEAIKKEIENGNIYEKVDYKIVASNGEKNITIFDGFQNLDSFSENLENGVVSVNLSPKDDLRTFTEKLNSVVFSVLEKNGIFKDSDNVKVPYIVEKVSTVLENLILSSSAFSVIKSSLEFGKNLSDDITNTTAHSVGGLTGPVAGTTFGVGAAIWNAIFGFSLVVQLKNVYTNFREAFYPPVREHNVMSFRTIMSRTCEHFGYEFSSTISELDNEHHLPSNLGVDSYGSNGFLDTPQGTKTGVPNLSDGELFNCGGWFAVMVKTFQARIKIIDNVVHFERELSEFWNGQGKFVLKHGFKPSYRFNADELNRSIQLGFRFDSADIYTIKNSDRTSITVHTESTDYQDKKALIERGYLNIQLPWALGNLKETETTFEKSLGKILGVIKGVINVFGGSFGGGAFDKRIGALKVGTNNTQAKVLWLENGKIPTDHREKLNARKKWESGINKLSFVENDFGGQFKIFEGVQNISVGVAGFSQLIQSRFATDEDGNKVEITAANWKMTADKLENLDYKQQFVYTKKLKQTITDLK